jgi:hypothetical protein
MDWCLNRGSADDGRTYGDVVAQTRSELADIADSIRSHRFIEPLRTRRSAKSGWLPSRGAA